jgi:hypothetical protein
MASGPFRAIRKIILERDAFSLTRLGIHNCQQIRFTMLAGEEAGMDEQTVFDGSSRAGRCGG